MGSLSLISEEGLGLLKLSDRLGGCDSDPPRLNCIDRRCGLSRTRGVGELPARCGKDVVLLECPSESEGSFAVAGLAIMCVVDKGRKWSDEVQYNLRVRVV